MFKIYLAAWEMGGACGWTVLGLLAGIPAATLLGCAALLIGQCRPKPAIRRRGRFSR